MSPAGSCPQAQGADVASRCSIDKGSGGFFKGSSGFNRLLAAQDSEYRVAMAEYITTGDGELASENVIIARDLGNKRLSLDFIPNDPRRGGLDGDPNTIDVLIDQTQGATGGGVTEAATTGAITAAMNSWDARSCSALGMNILPVGVDLGLVQRVLGFGGGVAVPDLMHAGWLPGAFFDRLAPGGSRFILGVTFTLTFNSGDLDGNGLPDLALREIYSTWRPSPSTRRGTV